jgi:hypothetical protein
VFVIRGSPGPISSKAQDVGFVAFRYESTAYEIHLGVQYKGSPGVLHEFDVLIIPAADANESRKTKRLRARPRLRRSLNANAIATD